MPSCGVVFRDEWWAQLAAGAGDEEKPEIVIVGWNGDT